MGKKTTDVVMEADASEFDVRRDEDPTESSQQTAHVDTNVPSSVHEQRIVDKLQRLLDASRMNLRESVKVRRIALAALFFHQGAPVAITFVVLVISCWMYPTAQTITCTVLFSILYALCMSVQVYLLWARNTEKMIHAYSVMSNVLARWRQRITVMSKMKRQTPYERRAAFRESTAVLPAKAFRMVAVLNDSTGRMKHILKCLLIKGSTRLDESKLCARPYTESTLYCKLIDVMRITLESSAIVLRPLQDKARPPRHANYLHFSSNAKEEEVNTTDESDHEHDPRTDVSGANTNSVPQKMEFLVHRIFLLIWLLGMLLTVAAGCIFYVFVDAPIGEGVFLYPAVALLGMLPVNVILLNRVLVLYANVCLEQLFNHLVSRPVNSLDDRIPRFSFLFMWKALWRVLRHRPGSSLLCFSSSIVEVLGMATVVALLDTTGVVTDMVPLPVLMLMCKCDEEAQTSSSSDDEVVTGTTTTAAAAGGNNSTGMMQYDEMALASVAVGEATTTTTTTTAALTESAMHEQRKPERKRLARRKKFQDRMFFEMRLTLSQSDNLAVEFADEKEFKARQANINPVSLCLLLHALLPESKNLETWTERFRFCDRTVRWARSIHWIPRASNFDDHVVDSFRILARIFQIDTETQVGYQNDYTEQACTLLAVGEDNVIHTFTIGTVYMVTHNCPFYFSGSSIQELKDEARTELIHVGKMAWEEGMGLETIAVAHRMVPNKYSHIIENHFQINNKNDYHEYFFCNKVQITGEGERRKEKTNGRENPQGNHQNDKKEEEGGVEEGEEEESEEAPPLLDDLLDFLVGNSYVFLSLVGLRDSIRPNVQNAMALLDEAGIRCMYFCSENERRTKSLGDRLGLETDWNCCISLKEGAVELDHHSIRAQLPVGIKSIRKHILHVDPIPLQVKMFSHAHGVSTRAMLSVLQDNHEVVVTIGSAFNHGNVRSFIQSDLSIGVLPTRRGPVADKEDMYLSHHGHIVEPSDFYARKAYNRDLPLYRNVAELIGSSCTLSASPTPSILPIVTTLIRQARLRLSGIGNCVEFALHANFFVTLVNVFALMTGSPLLISPTATVFELNVIIPIFALSCTYTAYADIEPMKTISSRHNYFVRLAIFRHSVLVWCLRYIPSLVALLFLGITCGVKMCKRSVVDLSLSASDPCMTSTRGYIVLTMNYWLMVHSWTHISRHHPLAWNLSFKTRYGRRSTYLFKSFRLISAFVLTTLLGIIFVIIDTSRDGVTSQAFYPSLVHFLAALLFPPLLLLIDVPIKSWRSRRFALMQKFRRLSFGTRLGMHSPRGDYEPEGVTYTSAMDEGAGRDDENRVPTLKQRLHDVFYRFTTIKGGKLELNCVCCDHIGGNYATYHTNGSM